MEHKQMRSFHSKVVLQQQNGQPKVITPSPANFIRVPDVSELHNVERPMMLNAWTQTTPTNFDYLSGNSIKSEEQRQTENELLEKIRILEENLRAHSEILAQMHVTTANRQFNSANVLRQYSVQPSLSSPASSTSTSTTPQPAPPHQQLPHPQYPQHQIYHVPRPEQNQPQREPQPSVQYGDSTGGDTQNIAGIINQVQPGPIESVNYTIIAEANSETNGGPIEIQLAEENNAMNCSAESGRLQICLAEENADIKTEFGRIEPSTLQQYQQNHQESPQLISSAKRRRLNKKAAVKPETIESQKLYVHEDCALTSSNTSNVQPHVKQLTPATTERTDSHAIKQNVQNSMQIQDPRIDLDNVMVSIGPYNTRVPAKIYENMSWASPSLATRKLLMAIFDRRTLATHSMTGKPSPAFKNDDRPLKEKLNQRVVKDIIYAVTRKCHVSEKEVRSAITTKCADENKMMKLQQSKLEALLERNKENIS